MAILPVVHACSCSPRGNIAVCQLVNVAEIVFVGKASALHIVKQPYDAGPRLYDFLVEKVYKGLPPETTSITINAGFATCQRIYEVGARHAVFAFRNKTTGEIFVDPCHGGVRDKDLSANIRFLDAFAGGQAGRQVRGNALRRAPLYDYPFEADFLAPVEGATLELASPTLTLTTPTLKDGSFLFEGLPPGPYVLTVRSTAYTTRQKRYTLSVPEQGCEEVYPAFDPSPLGRR